MPELPSDVTGRITDSDGDRIEVEVYGPHVYLTATSKGFSACVRLGAADQERFAQAYVAACHQAKVNADAVRTTAGRADG